MPTSKARQKRNAEMAAQQEEHRKKQLNEARLRLFGLMLIAVGCLAGLYLLPLTTTPLLVVALLFVGLAVCLVLMWRIATPILNDMRDGSGQQGR